MKKGDLKISENTVVHCPTEELANEVLSIADELGYRWVRGSSFKKYNKYREYGEHTCYCVYEGQFTYYNWYKAHGYDIISAEEFIKLHKEGNEPLQRDCKGVFTQGVDDFVAKVDNKCDKVYMFKKIAEEMSELYERKNKDYNDSFGKSFAEYGLTMPCIRLEDKLNRLKSLTKNTQQVNDESIEDTLMDLAAYSIMTIIELKNTKE